MTNPAPPASPLPNGSPGAPRPGSAGHGRDHILPPENQRYADCPPASGHPLRHPGRPDHARYYGPDDATLPEGWVHNLEHGGLVILYSCDQGACDRRHAAGAPGPLPGLSGQPAVRLPKGNIGPVITRFEDMKAPIAALLWGRVLFQDKLDTAQILEFFKTQAELKNPEQQCARPSPTPAPGSSTTPSEALVERVTGWIPERRPSAVPNAPSSAAPSGPGEPGHIAQPFLTGASDAPVRLRDRFDCDRFGVVVADDRFLTGRQLERVGGLPGVIHPLGIANEIRFDKRWQRRLQAPSSAPAQGRRAEATGQSTAGRCHRPRQDRLRRAELPRPHRGGRIARPDRPLLFAKFANAVIGDGEPIVRPAGTHALDLEAELGVVIGRRARGSPRADAMSTSPATSSATTSRPVTGRAAQRRSARASGATASGCGPRAPTRSCRWARSSSPPTRCRSRAGLRSGRGGSRARRPDAGTREPMQDGNDRRHDLRRPRADRVHQPRDHPRSRRHHRDRNAVGRRRLPRSAGVPRAGGSGSLRDRRASARWRIRSSTGRARRPTDGTMLALVKTAAGPGLELREVPEPVDRHQRRPDPGPQDRDLRHGPPHRVRGIPGPPGRSSRRSSSATSSSARSSRSAATSPTSSPATSSAARATSCAAGAATAWPDAGTCAPTRSGSASAGTAPSPSTSSCR